MTVLIYSAIFGGRDVPHVQARQVGVDATFLLFTDDPELEAPEPWQVLYRRPVADHPNMAAKWWKTHPPMVVGSYEVRSAPVTPVTPGWEASIWVDAAVEITEPRFARSVLDLLAETGAPLAAFAHPRRDSVYDEAVASVGPEGLGRYDELGLSNQIASYHVEKYPDHAGLWCGGIVAWSATETARGIGRDWWDECVRWGFQDQVSLPVVCWRRRIRPATFPVPIIERHRRHGGLANRWLTLHPHEPGTDHPGTRPATPAELDRRSDGSTHELADAGPT